jgi:threo-3-hydroxy-L-aspartate ammonia-lyase
MPRYEHIEEAARRIEGVAHLTPVVTSRTLNARLGGEIFLKCENLQRMGAFKFRGAWNALSKRADEARQRGVLAYSSGNHAQAVALASQLLGARATIVMPKDAPLAKRHATEGYGARIVTYDPATESREEIARSLAEDGHPVLIPPFDHEDVIAGAGTAARELLLETGPLDILLVCVGGGGLLAGSALAARALAPACRVIGVEPEAGDDGVRSFRAGTLQTVRNPKTIADGARTPCLGQITFPLIRANVDDMLTVTDAELIETLRFVWERMKLVVEPTGVLGLAAAFCRHVDVAGRRVGVIVSGGNVDLSAAAGWLRES